MIRVSFCIICSIRKSRPVLRLDTGQQHSHSSNLTEELDELCNFSLSSLTAFLAVLAVSGSKTVLPGAVALLIYTISLRLGISTCFLQHYTILSKFLYTVPLLGTFCMAGTVLVLHVQSPAIAVPILLLSVFPFFTTIVHHEARCEETPLPVRMRDALPIVWGPSDVNVVSLGYNVQGFGSWYFTYLPEIRKPFLKEITRSR